MAEITGREPLSFAAFVRENRAAFTSIGTT